MLYSQIFLVENSDRAGSVKTSVKPFTMIPLTTTNEKTDLSRGWPGAGVGVGMEGFPYLKYKVQSFKISKFQNCRISNVDLQVAKYMGRTFPKQTNFSNITFAKIIVLKIIWDFLYFQSILVPSKSRIIVFGSHGHVRQVRNHRNDDFSGFPIMNPKNY